MALLFALLQATMLFSQPVNWEPIPPPDIPANPRDLYYSANLNITLYCGVFDGGPGYYYISAYNGESWEMLRDSVNGFINCAADYEDGLLCGGTDVSARPETDHVGLYDGNEWTYPWHFNDNVRRLEWVNDTLFAFGTFTEIDGVSIYKVAKLAGDTWQPVINENPELGNSPFFNDIAYYQGDYYVAGNFHLPEGPNDFARINNMELEQVGEGLFGSWVMIGSLEVYQDELYIGGRIPVAHGNVGNNIVRWNGEEYDSVGQPMFVQQGVFDNDGGAGILWQRDGYLFAAGKFYYIGEEEISSIARWDGTEWCGLWGRSFLYGGQIPPVMALGYFQDQIMLGRNFEYEDGSTDVFWLFEGGDEVEVCTTLSTRESQDQIPFQLFPNPSSSHITIQSQAQLERIEILDISGRKVLEKSVFPRNGTIDISGLPAGIYLVKVQTADGNFGVEKLVVE